MSAPWTPGPWEICGDAIRSPIVMEDGHQVDGGIEIARVLNWLPEAQANLRLLRAAPALVEALTELADAPEGQNVMGGYKEAWARLDAAREKARSVLASLHPEPKP